MSESSETFRKFRTLLGGTVDAYNNIRRTSRKVEFNLIEVEVATVDALISRGENELCWKSEGLLEYITELDTLVQGLWTRLKVTQSNVAKIESILEHWTKTPLIERKDRRKDALLSIDERQEKVSKRYADIQKAAEGIHALLNENKALFEATGDDNESWEIYVNYVDGIVAESLRRAVGCCLGYLAENMDPSGQKEPLLEAKLELREPDLFYVPSLEPEDPDGLDQLIAGLLNDMIGMAALVPRLKSNAEGYGVEMENDDDIKAMKSEILTGVVKAVEDATEFCGIFEGE